MSTNTEPRPEDPLLDEEDLQGKSVSSKHRVEVLDAAAGAAAGAVAGILLGPVGAAAGAVVGAAIGAVVGHALEGEEEEVAQRNSELDDIGRDDPVALSRRWAEEMPQEVYSKEEAAVATSRPSRPPEPGDV